MSQDFLFSDSEVKQDSPRIAEARKAAPALLAIVEDLIQLDTQSKWARTELRVRAIELTNKIKEAANG